MSKPFDAATKRLVESQPSAWLNYLGLSGDEATLMETDLTTVTSEADRVLRVKAPTPYLAHVEFQSSYKEMDVRVLRYNTLVFCRHGIPVQSVVVLLRREADGAQVTGRIGYVAPDGGSLEFRYQVVRVWEKSLDAALSGGLATLPLAPLVDIPADRLPEVIQRMEARIAHEATEGEAGMLWTATYLLMGLRYRRAMIDNLLKGVRGMKESTTYQGILEEGEAVGISKGKELGRAEEARSLLLKLGGKRFGSPDAQIQTRLAAIISLEQLEQLAERLLEAESWNELLA